MIAVAIIVTAIALYTLPAGHSRQEPKFVKIADNPAVGQESTGQADAGSAVVGGSLYVVGGYGYTARDRLNAVSVYSPADNAWSAGPSYPVWAWGIACSAVRTSLFCFGGEGAGLRAYKLDTRDSQWTRLQDMPAGYNNSQGQVAVADPQDNQVFIIGSSSNLQANRTTLAYDIVHDSYAKKGDMPYGNGWFTAAFYQGRIYTIGGTHGNEVLVYDIAGGTWNRVRTNLPGPSRFGMVRNPGVVSGLIPIIDGKHSGVVFYNSTYLYDIANNRFIRGPDSLLARDGMAGGVIGNAFYVVGGRNNQNTPKGLTMSEEMFLGPIISNYGA